MKAKAIGLAVSFFFLGLPCVATAQEQGGVEVDWIENYEGLQAEHSYEYLLNCWAQQWPNGVKFSSDIADSNIATDDEISAAIAATRSNCDVEVFVRLDQINVDLAREGLPVSEIEREANLRLERELSEMFDEFWSRL